MTRLPAPITCGKVLISFHRTQNRMRAVVDIGDESVLRPEAGSHQRLKIMLLAQLAELAHDLQCAETAVWNLK